MLQPCASVRFTSQTIPMNDRLARASELDARASDARGVRRVLLMSSRTCFARFA